MLAQLLFVNNLENGSFCNRENLQYKKIADSLFWVCSWELMESATILMPLSTGLSSIQFHVRTQYSWKTRIWKNINTIWMYGGKFYQLHAAQRQLLGPLNNLEKTDSSEIEWTYNIRKQQTWFYWVCSWELMELRLIDQVFIISHNSVKPFLFCLIFLCIFIGLDKQNFWA